jgi:pimeloyl-ACP methyl ester carboxylesterase
MPKTYTEEYVEINGIAQYFLHYPVDAEAVVVMVHGGPGYPNSYTAYKLMPHFGFCNVVYYDQRGAGKTALKNKTNYNELSLDIFIEDLKQTIQYVNKKYKTDKVFICAHSWGTVLGTQLIIKYPLSVAGYIGFGQVVDVVSQDKSWFQFLKHTVQEKGNRRDKNKINSISNDYPNVSFEEFSRATTILDNLELKYGYQPTKLMPLYRKSPLMTFRDGFQIAKNPKLNEKLRNEVFYNYSILDIESYKAPVYYVLGRQDEWTTSTIAAKYFDTFQAPKKKLYWIENAGHLLDTDQPEAFGRVVKEIVTGE